LANRPNIPDVTSAEALGNYPPGLKVAEGKGPAWKDVRASVFSLNSLSEQFPMPAIVEPFLVWVISGEAETMERENEQAEWFVAQVKAGSLFLTAAAVPYEFRWRRLSDEPFQVMVLILSLPLWEEALVEVHASNAPSARLADRSGFEDPWMLSLLERLRSEVTNPTPSALLVRGLGQALAVHLARTYSELREPKTDNHASLPAYKLKTITQWMEDHLANAFTLSGLAQQAGMSEFHFNRLFKRAMGMPPSQYLIKLRIERARRLLRETPRSVIDIANEVGYSNASHFARLFRKVTGVTPSDYRRQVA
jgi:AraC family transcriptional regulator